MDNDSDPLNRGSNDAALRADSRPFLSAGASMPLLEGVDVSSYQGIVDWQLVRGTGRRFAFIKASEGLEFRDPTFPHNWEGTRLRGIERGAYHFFYDHLSGSEQCDYHHEFVREEGHYRYGECGIVDVEEVSVSNRTKCITELKAYIQRFWRTVNKPVGIYTNSDTWVNLLGDPNDPVFRACFLWQANLGPYAPSLRAWPSGLSFMQYSWTGHVPGIGAQTDLNRFWGTTAQLQRLFRVVPHV